jgi:membrane protein
VSKRERFTIQTVRIVLLAFRRFREDRCQLRASALTYYTLISIVPILAMIFGITRGFGIEDRLQHKLLQEFPYGEEVVNRSFEFANAYLEKARGGVVAGIGVLILFWTVVRALNTLENSFNDIWGAGRSRGFARQLVDYLFLIFVCPLLLLVSSSITLFVATYVSEFLENYGMIGAITSGEIILKCSPYFIVWALFSFLYLFIPNVRVRWQSALVAGIVAGTLYQLAQWGFINCQIFVSRVNAIYGSFSALPLFLFWIQLSWMIVLLGAEIAFACQNAELYEFEFESESLCSSSKRLFMIAVMHLIVSRFQEGKPPCSADEIARTLEIPIRLTRNIIGILMGAGLVSEVVSTAEGTAFQPATNVEKLTIHDLSTKVGASGVGSIPFRRNSSFDSIEKHLAGIDRAMKESRDNLPIQNL